MAPGLVPYLAGDPPGHRPEPEGRGTHSLALADEGDIEDDILVALKRRLPHTVRCAPQTALAVVAGCGDPRDHRANVSVCIERSRGQVNCKVFRDHGANLNVCIERPRSQANCKVFRDHGDHVCIKRPQPKNHKVVINAMQ